MERRKNNFKDIKTLTSREVMYSEWMGIDEISDTIALSKSKIYDMVAKGDFPLPYRSKGRSSWLKQEVMGFIASLSEEWNGSEFKAVTWKDVSKLFDDQMIVCWTNRDIAEALDANVNEVSQITRMMHKAGEINAFKHPCGVGKLYSRAQTIDLRLEAEQLT